jgi:hypothetical protein
MGQSKLDAQILERNETTFPVGLIGCGELAFPVWMLRDECARCLPPLEVLVVQKHQPAVPWPLDPIHGPSSLDICRDPLGVRC